MVIVRYGIFRIAELRATFSEVIYRRPVAYKNETSLKKVTDSTTGSEILMSPSKEKIVGLLQNLFSWPTHSKAVQTSLS